MNHTDMFTTLVRAEIDLWNSLEQALLNKPGITVPTFQSLSAIEALETPARVQDISEAMRITVGATSKLVDRLERDGLVTRTANPDDRRSSLIILTDAGKATLASAATATETHLAAILGGAPVQRLSDDLATLRASINGAAE